MQPSNLVLFREMVCILVILSGETMKAELRRDGNSLLFLSDYDPNLVQALKTTVPAEARRWDKARKAWFIDPLYGATVAKLAKDYCNVDLQVPLVLNSHAPNIRLLKVEYLGRTKERYNGERSAFAWVDGDWNAVFPESVLVAWFDGTASVASASTLYSVLGVKSVATLDEIKTAHRRLARQWHPDVCQEPDAKERFIEIQHAYEVLKDETQRRKYDAGLALERSLKPAQRVLSPVAGYRAPLRCGWVLCVGTESLGRFIVSEIKQWEDIVNDQGQVMVVSWPLGADKFIVNWV